MLKTIDRLIQFIEHVGLSARQFDISIGAANGYTLRMKKNHASVGSDVLENILRTYPQLNVVWLLTGKGQMLNQKADKNLPEFEKLSTEQRKAIEIIIEQKIREQHEKELKNMLKEVTNELRRNDPNSSS